MWRNSSRPGSEDCSQSLETQILGVIFALIKALFVLPLCLLVVAVALRRRRRRRRGGGGGAALSHLDLLAFHMVAVETVSVLNACLFSLVTFVRLRSAGPVLGAGYALSYQGQMYFHTLTCLDRYLAVVHPVLYLRLRARRSPVPVYAAVNLLLLLASAATYLWNVYAPYDADAPMLASLVLSCLLVSFCSLSVLVALKRPRPGEGERAGRLKRRAFSTTVTVQAVVLLWFLGILVGFSLNAVDVGVSECVVLMSCCLFSAPASAVLPLLFLHRAGKLPFVS